MKEIMISVGTEGLTIEKAQEKIDKVVEIVNGTNHIFRCFVLKNPDFPGLRVFDMSNFKYYLDHDEDKEDTFDKLKDTMVSLIELYS